jgi:hypothetical protein
MLEKGHRLRNPLIETEIKCQWEFSKKRELINL